MTAQSGRAFLLKVSDGGDPASYETVAGLRNTNFRLNSDTIDITNKGSAGWRELLSGAGQRNITIEGSGIFTGSSAETRVQSLAMTNSVADCQLTFEDGARFEGNFQISSLQYGGEHNSARTYTMTLESAGVIAFVGAT